MKLTNRQRQILEMLASEDPEDGSDEIVELGGEVWVGLERTNHATLLFFLRACLVKSLGGSLSDVYVISEYGRKALSDPDFDINTEKAYRDDM